MSLSSRSRRIRERARRTESGFTLIEVLISMAIMTMISFGIYQAWTTSFKLVGSLQSEGDFYNNIRLAMNVLERDVSLIYNPMLMLPPQPAASSAPGVPGFPAVPGAQPPLSRDQQSLQSLLQQNADLAQPTEFWGPVEDSTGIRPSRFVGSDRKISFIATSHLRVYRDAPESEFARVIYELQKDEDGDTMTLYKRENTNAFETENRGEKQFIRSYPLLRGIKKFRFRFYDKLKERGTWVNSWDSVSDSNKDAYPDIVEVELSVDGPDRLSFEGKYDFRPEVPLNGLDPST